LACLWPAHNNPIFPPHRRPRLPASLTPLPRSANATSATFVSLAQSLQYLSTIVAPLVGTWLAGFIGLRGALWLSAGMRLLGFFLFLLPERRRAASLQIAGIFAGSDPFILWKKHNYLDNIDKYYHVISFNGKESK
jgi:MFS family permease